MGVETQERGRQSLTVACYIFRDEKIHLIFWDDHIVC